MGGCLFKTNMKKLTFKNKKVLDLLKENEKLSKEINEIVTEWQKKDAYVKKLSMRMERIKDKIRPIVSEEVKKADVLEEFDIVQSTKYEKEDVIVEINNELELIKKQLRERNEKQKLGQANQSTGEDKGTTDAGENKGTEGKD
jgi:uncharacterized membrane protein